VDIEMVEQELKLLALGFGGYAGYPGFPQLTSEEYNGTNWTSGGGHFLLQEVRRGLWITNR
jgi:hypothetical protein